ncbi:MAG TPA: GDP-mannose 4,6-dehydratase [Candidatus Limnocylindria bacterium]|nr:GDP-mannose 4,6-dehydratase [Candidatus Limnocylindria bacterium]
MSTRRVLITGVSGFVGRHLTRALLARGEQVFGLGAEPASVDLRSALHEEWQADLRDLAAMIEVVEQARADAIVHLAAQSSASQSFANPTETYHVNAVGAWNLLEAIRRTTPKARVLLVGTGEIYGPQAEGTRVREDAPFHPVNPYALSKAVADAIAEVMARSNGLDVIRTRSFGHIGPGQTTRFVIPSVAQQIAAIEAGRAEPVLKVGNLAVTRDMIDARDVVDAYVALLDRGRNGVAYNVCGGEAVKLADLVHHLVRRSRVPIQIETDPARMRPADVPYLVGDPTRIETETGWRKSIPLDRTLDDVMEEWRAVA